MSKEQNQGGRIQWGRLVKKLNPYTIQKGFRYLEALWTEGILDPPA